MEGRIFYTLILRNVNERLEAEQKIRSLTIETEFLKEELHELQHFGEILGNSPALVTRPSRHPTGGRYRSHRAHYGRNRNGQRGDGPTPFMPTAGGAIIHLSK